MLHAQSYWPKRTRNFHEQLLQTGIARPQWLWNKKCCTGYSLSLVHLFFPSTDFLIRGLVHPGALDWHLRHVLSGVALWMPFFEKMPCMIVHATGSVLCFLAQIFGNDSSHCLSHMLLYQAYCCEAVDVCMVPFWGISYFPNAAVPEVCRVFSIFFTYFSISTYFNYILFTM